MPQINQINSSSVKVIIEECNLALQKVANKYGLSLSRKNCTYRPNEMPVPFKLTVKQISESGQEVDPDETAFKIGCFLYGLKEEDFGKTFIAYSSTYKICGLKRKNTKYPIIAENLVNGKKYKFAASDIKRYLLHQSTMDATDRFVNSNEF